MLYFFVSYVNDKMRKIFKFFVFIFLYAYCQCNALKILKF